MRGIEDDLLARAAACDRSAQDRLIRGFIAPLHAYVRLRMGPFLRARESVRDIVQNVCIDALERLPSWACRGVDDFRRGLFRVAEQRIVDRVRYHRSERRSPERERPAASEDDEELVQQMAEAYRESLVTPSRNASAREEITRVEAAFARLPDDYRRVILLSRFSGMSPAEIAEQMGRSQHAIWNLTSRALARLSMLLDEGE